MQTGHQGGGAFYSKARLSDKHTEESADSVPEFNSSGSQNRHSNSKGIFTSREAGKDLFSYRVHTTPRKSRCDDFSPAAGTFHCKNRPGGLGEISLENITVDFTTVSESYQGKETQGHSYFSSTEGLTKMVDEPGQPQPGSFHSTSSSHHSDNRCQFEGMGTHCLHRVVQGKWTSLEARNSINWLELRAIKLALFTFQDLIKKQFVVVQTDNITAKAHINRQGGDQRSGSTSGVHSGFSMGGSPSNWNGCSTSEMAKRPPVSLSPSPNSHQGPGQDTGGEGGHYSSGPLLAKETLLFRTDTAVSKGTLETPVQKDLPSQGPIFHPDPSWAFSLHGMETERKDLELAGLSKDITDIMFQARPATRGI